MDRMMLDLNLPPPPYWSPQAVPVLSPSSDTCPIPSAIGPPVGNSDTNLTGPELILSDSHSLPVAAGPEGDCGTPDVEEPITSNTRTLQHAGDLCAAGSTPETPITQTEKFSDEDVQFQSISGAKARESVPVSLPIVHAIDDVEEQLEKPRSLTGTVHSDSTDPSERMSTEDGGPVKVHKRLRTLGQLRSKKELKNLVAVVAVVAEESLEEKAPEDEVVHRSSGQGTTEVDEGFVATGRGLQMAGHSRSMKGEQSVLSIKEDYILGKDVLSENSGENICGVNNNAQPGVLSTHGRTVKFPSQPRSRKPEKRLLPISTSKVALDSHILENKASHDSTGGSALSSLVKDDKFMPDRGNRVAVTIPEGKSELHNELPRVSLDDAPSSGVKRAGGLLKDAMLGKRRRQTVLLQVDESLKQARPLRTPTTESGQGRVSRFRREITRPVSTYLPEHQEAQIYESVKSLSQVGSVSRKSDELPEENLQFEKLQPIEGTGQFRRPPLKRQTSSVLIRDDASVSGREDAASLVKDEPPSSSNFNRGDILKGLDAYETRHCSSPNEGPVSQKQRMIPGKKQMPAVQDASVERLHREATCNKLWRNAGVGDLKKVPGSFESVDEYRCVLEPLLFEECRAQLHSSWEELIEGSSKDAHVPVSIKGVERRERGWYDVVLLPDDPHITLKFKEGDVAVISTPRPGSGGRFKGRSKGEILKEGTRSVTGRITGIVRCYFPIDLRDPSGAILHFHVSQDEIDNASSQADPTTINGNAMKELDHHGVTWYLTVLGGVTTTQREYLALNFLDKFHPKMLNAILHPQAELFPGYKDQEPPPMPECFTPAFVQHLHEKFNGPQLAAIQWAGAHTAAGSGNNNIACGVPKQEPWPFTLVQGPPGTGKTHTVWGMLNVIHLVQYQRYYQALLRKLAPSSVAAEETSTLNQGSFENGSIDDVLQRMDDSLARMLPKLCPKPRMLVCAPSNAATDELLSRVLDRGFIDGEMKLYRPDVARVGSDPHSRAAQAVSVERRSEQLLGMGHDKVLGWLQQLRGKELTCSHQIASLQRDLNEVATTRSQGNLGVDPEKLAARDQARDTKLQQLAALVEERDKILVEMSRLFIVEGRFHSPSRFTHHDARQKLEASFANEAEIVFTTVSSSGRRIFTKLAHGFDMVVIDEAAQASEVAVLPPLSLRAARCVLVGDPQQLPATVISRVADTMQYSRSLFERFQLAGCPAILLSVQYRMHPQIRDFPSRHFYQGRLVDSESVRERPDEIYHQDLLLQPYLFYDISQGRESHCGSVSYQNKLEAQVAVRLYLHLQKAMAAAGIGNVSVGMITPYKQQLRCLQSEFEALVGANADSKGVYINTVDAFQGQERDVIMMSCVRASTHGVGFVADIRRMNVALTRARRSLWVIGNAAALLQSEDWAALLADAKSRGSIVETSTCIAHGLLPDPPGVLGLSQPGQGLLRLARPGILRVGSPSGRWSSQCFQGDFSQDGFGRGRQQDDVPVHVEPDPWPVSGHRGPRLHHEGLRGGFGQGSLPLNRSLGRPTNLPFRRGRG